MLRSDFKAWIKRTEGCAKCGCIIIAANWFVC